MTMMKIRMALALTAAAAFLQPLNAKADDLFQLFWRGTYYTKNASGHIIARNFTEQDFVREVARNNGLDPSQCIFVYRPDRRDTVVVRRNGAFVADVIQMEFVYTDVTNPNHTVTVRQALLYDEAHQDPIGSWMGLEKRRFNARGGLADDQLNGQIQYSFQEKDAVYSGHAWTGQRIVDKSGAP